MRHRKIQTPGGGFLPAGIEYSTISLPSKHFPIAEFLKEDSLTATDKMYPPEKKGQGLVLEGDINETADKLVAILKEKTTVVR
jgi:electron transfer flavoprotein alpha/beta subunit